MAEEDDGPPPLEDMTAQLTLRQQLLGKQNPPAKAPTPDSATTLKTTKTSPSASSAPATSSVAPQAATKKSTPNSGGGFGGFNKGFLSGGKPPKATAKAATPKSATQNPSPAAAGSGSAARTTAASEDEIPFLKASRDATMPGQLPEVQEAMSKASGFLSETKDQWLNKDLLEKLKKRPNLLRQLNDPKLPSALSEFQTNPGAAKAKYADSPEITGFFKEFFEVMGQHMMELGDKEEAAKQEAGAAAGPPVSPEDQAHLDKIMQDPEVVEALKHPGVQRLLQTLREQPQQGHIAMQAVSRDPELARRVKVLYGAGLLGVARNVPS